MSMNALAIGLAGLAIAACSNPETTSVVLLHCGMKPVTVEGRLWEAPPQTVDDDSMLPLDAGNRPDDWVGQGTVVVTDDRMTYTDQGGEVVEFVPDDGIPLGVCM